MVAEVCIYVGGLSVGCGGERDPYYLSCYSHCSLQELVVSEFAVPIPDSDAVCHVALIGSSMEYDHDEWVELISFISAIDSLDRSERIFRIQLQRSMLKPRVSRLKACTGVIYLVSKEGSLPDLWGGFVIRDSLDSPSQALYLTAVCEVAVNLQSELAFCSCDSPRQIIPCYPESCLVTCSEGSHPWFLVGEHSDGFSHCIALSTLVDVIHHRFCVL